jgi:hypothetical protein
VGLDIADCAFGKDGLTVALRRSKTDRTARAVRSVFPTVRIHRLARFARFRRGWKSLVSTLGRCSGRSLGMSGYSLGGCQESMLPAW